MLRRDFIRHSAALLGLAALPRWTLAAQSGAQLMRTIPSSGETIPAIGMGTWQTFDIEGSGAEREALREVLRGFVEQGGRLIDSSPMYGRAESVVGDLARELRLTEKLFVATKVWTSGRDAGIRQMQASMTKLGVTRLDLMQIHNLVDWQTHIATLRDWREAGRIRYIGITHYTESAYGALENVMSSTPLDFVQLNYSIVSRGAERRLLPLAQEKRIGVIVNRPFEGSGLFGKVRGKALPTWAADFDCATWAQFFLKFILSHPAISCAIPATSKLKHLLDNMQAGQGRLPDAQQREKMAQYVRDL